MAAQKAKEAADSDEVNVTIIPTKSTADAYEALALVDLEAPFDEIVSTMNDSLECAVSCQIAVAARDSVCDGIAVKEGQNLIIINGKVLGCALDLNGVINVLRAQITDAKNKESVVIFCRNDIMLAAFGEKRADLNSVFPSAEIFFYNGVQAVYDYVLAIM